MVTFVAVVFIRAILYMPNMHNISIFKIAVIYKLQYYMLYSLSNIYNKYYFYPSLQIAKKKIKETRVCKFYI